MDIYGLPSNSSTQELFRIDDLLDFSNDELFTTCSSSTATTNATNLTSDTSHLLPPLEQTSDSFNPDDLSALTDDVAELEWLSQFVHDSFADFPMNSVAGTMTVRQDTSVSGRERSKRSRAAASASTWNWTSSGRGKSKHKRDNHRQKSPTTEDGIRRCTHCASEKTPQWRSGPLGPKTLCNACGVRYKSGRLVPEYRPAASPTFLLTQHSNSHRKVMELRRLKDQSRQRQQQQQQQQQQGHGQVHRHQRDFEV